MIMEDPRKAALDILKEIADLLKIYAENHMKKDPTDIEGAKINFDAHNKILWAIITLQPSAPVGDIQAELEISRKRVEHYRQYNVALRKQIEIYKAANRDDLQ